MNNLISMSEQKKTTNGRSELGRIYVITVKRKENQYRQIFIQQVFQKAQVQLNIKDKYTLRQTTSNTPFS